MPENKAWVIDIETGGFERAYQPDTFGKNYLKDFFAASKGDFKSSPYYLSTIDRKTGKPFQLLEFFASDRDGDYLFPDDQWHGFYSTSAVNLKPQPGFQISDFARQHGIEKRARTNGLLNNGLTGPGSPVTEEEFANDFFSALDTRVRGGEKVSLEAWNGIYDLSFLESLTHRYDSLSQYQGWFADQAEAGMFEFRASEDELFKLAWKYGEQNPEFAKQNFIKKPTGEIAKTWEELRQTPFWSVENVTNSLGGWGQFITDSSQNAHNAMADVAVEQRATDAFRRANQLVDDGYSVEDAIQSVNILDQSKRQTPGSFFDDLFSTGWKSQINRETSAGEAALRDFTKIEETIGGSLKGPGIVIGLAASAAIAAGLAFGKRSDRQTQIEGLQHTGVMGRRRRDATDFGSGWQGLNTESQPKQHYLGLGLIGAGYASHRWALSNKAGYAEGLYSTIKKAEERFPGKIIKTLGFGQVASQYIPDNLTLKRHQVFKYWGNDLHGNPLPSYSELGAHLQRLVGDKTDLSKLDWSDPNQVLRFKRDAGSKSAFLRMHIGDEATSHLVSFAEKGTFTQSSQRYKRPQSELFHKYSEAVPWENTAGEKTFFQPYLGWTEGQAARSMGENASRGSFAMLERLNRVLEDVHLGIPHGTYSTSAGLVGRILAQRVLPIALGLTAAKFVDYKLHHAPSNFVWDLSAKAKIAHAELTDRTPGARSTTDWYSEHVPGPWYSPLALPLSGALLAGGIHSVKVAAGRKFANWAERATTFRRSAKIGGLIGAIAMIPFIPGMLGSRKTADEVRDVYSGDTPVAIHQGRWWEAGSTKWGGGRIVSYRPHAYVLHKTRAEDASVYRSEEEKWAHNPIVSPLTWLKDPNWLEKQHYEDRPYPVSSPALSNIPILGPMLAATIGKIIKPAKRMHEDEWNGNDYTLTTKQLEPKGPNALAPAEPETEFGLSHVAKRTEDIAAEMIGLPGFIGKSLVNKLKPENDKPDVFFEGSRNMTDPARRFYEMELGALYGPTAEGQMFGYSEPIRRFLQHDREGYRVNELKNKMPSWLPGSEYMTDFKKGDPYTKVQMGFARLPGAGYEAVHPELKGLDPEKYPDIDKLRILGDVAPWSANFVNVSKRVAREAENDTELKIEYEKILERTEEMRRSTVQFSRRHSGETEEVKGTVETADERGVRLKEYPGRVFHLSSLDMNAAALSSRALGKTNQEIARSVEEKQQQRSQFLASNLKKGTSVRAILSKGGIDTTDPSAIIFAGDQNINRELLDKGFAKLDLDKGGAETQYLDGAFGRLFRKYTEAVSFTGDQAWYNPLRYTPRLGHAKFWQQRDAITQYEQDEVYGSRIRRWQRPIHDFIMPWFHQASNRLTGEVIVTSTTQERRGLDTLTDQLRYIRGIYGMGQDPSHRGAYSLQVGRTSIGGNLEGNPKQVRETLSTRDRKYFDEFLRETDPDNRAHILNSSSGELAAALTAQWAKQVKTIDEAEGTSREAGLSDEDHERALKIAQFFKRKGLRLPDPDSEVVSPDLDYEDVKAKIVQFEGLDYHDFNIYQDRMAMLWRKPYLDGAVRELTSGDDRSLDDMTTSIEQAIALSKSKNPNAKVRATRHASQRDTSNIKVTVNVQPDDELRQEVRRNPDDYS